MLFRKVRNESKLKFFILCELCVTFANFAVKKLGISYIAPYSPNGLDFRNRKRGDVAERSRSIALLAVVKSTEQLPFLLPQATLRSPTVSRRSSATIEHNA